MPEPVLPPKYKYLADLGQGSSGAVFLVQNTQTGKENAFKWFHPDTSLVDAFHAEVRALSRLSHPRIVQLRDHGMWQDRPFLVFDHIRGPTLDAYLTPKVPDTNKALIKRCVLILQLLGAVEHLHAAGLVHRDLKPGNIMVESPQLATIKLLDFGFVRLRDGSHEKALQGLGTLGYAAPEQVRHFDLSNEQSDLFSVGVILYECLTGEKPFQDWNDLFGNQPPAAPHAVNPIIPEKLSRFMLTLIDRDPFRRPHSAQAAADSLDGLLFPEATTVDLTGFDKPFHETDWLAHAEQCLSPSLPLSAQSQRHLDAETGGNPALVREYLSCLARAGCIQRTFGEMQLSPDQPFEDGWRQTPHACFAPITRLSAEGRNLLQAAAVLGDPGTVEALAFLTEASESAVKEQLSSLTDQGLLSWDAQTNNVHFPAHRVALHCQATATDANRRQLHMQAFRYKKDHAPPAVLACHLNAAGQAGQAWHYYLTAATRAHEQRKRGEAADLLVKALGLNHAPPQEDLSRAADLLLACGRPNKAFALLDRIEENMTQPLPAAHLLMRGNAERLCGKLKAAYNTLSRADTRTTRKMDISVHLKILSSLGACCRSLDHLKEAETTYQAMLKDARQATQAGHIIEALHGLGLVAKAGHRLADAEALLAEAVAEARQHGDTPRAAIALNNLGNVLRARHKHEDAAACFREALAARQTLGDIRGLAITYNNLAQQAIEQGDLPQALKAITESYHRFLETGDLKGQAISLGNRGMFLGLAGQLDPSMASLARANRLAKRMGDTAHAQETALALAQITLLRDEAKAGQILKRLLSDPPPVPDRLAAMAHNTLARLYAHQKDMEKALAESRSAQALLTDDDAPEDRSEVLAAQAEILSATGRMEDALAMAKEAYALVKTGASPFSRGHAARLLGWLWFSKGPTWADKAEKYLTEAVNVLSAAGTRYELAQAKAAMAYFMVCIGDEKNGAALAREALAAFEAMGTPRALKDINELLKEVL